MGEHNQVTVPAACGHAHERKRAVGEDTGPALARHRAARLCRHPRTDEHDHQAQEEDDVREEPHGTDYHGAHELRKGAAAVDRAGPLGYVVS